MSKLMVNSASLVCGLMAIAISGAPVMGSLTTFDGGELNGWSNTGRTGVSPTGGNPGAVLDEPALDVFGAEIRNSTNADVIGNFGARGPVTFSIDIETVSINPFFDPGFQYTRDLVLNLRQEVSGEAFPYVSVYFPLGILRAANPGFVTYSVTIEDPTATALPAGWLGSGDEDPVTFEPRLPAGYTFASVLSNVTEVQFTTLVPGFFFGFTDYYLKIDNIEVSYGVIPEPSGLGLLVPAGALLMRRRQ